MPKFRKKPVVIEAWQYPSLEKMPVWLVSAFDNGTVEKIDGEIIIHTLEGDLHTSLGDYIIKGVKEELYPCKPDIFAATYDSIDG
jgi:hypothetical protein